MDDAAREFAEAAEESLVGRRLGSYELLARLGAGGMGEVYRARDVRLDRIVAIKVLAPHLAEEPDFRRRFEREARTISQLSHPHICTLHDIGRRIRRRTQDGRSTIWSSSISRARRSPIGCAAVPCRSIRR